jgi:hypothetical protein
MTMPFRETLLNGDLGQLRNKLSAAAANRPHERILAAFADYLAAELDRRGWPKSKDRGFGHIIVEAAAKYPVTALAGLFYDATGRVLPKLMAAFRDIHGDRPTRPWSETDRPPIEAALAAEIAPLIRAGCPAVGQAYAGLLIGELVARGWPQKPIPRTYWPDPPRAQLADVDAGEIAAAYRPVMTDAAQTAAKLVDRIFSE